MNRDPAVLRWGFLGASDIAHTRLLGAVNAQADSRVVSVLSRDPARARAYAAQHGIERAFDNLNAFLADEDLDVVYISTTNEKHRDEALAALAAGKHVLCEKPLALNLEDASTMVRTAAEDGLVFGTNHHLRNAATHRAMRRLVLDGTLGEILAVRVFHAVYLPPRLQGWRLDNPAAGGGVMLDITVHDADVLHFLLGRDAEEVTAISVAQGLGQGGLEDAVMGVIRFSGGALAQFHDAFTVAHAGTGLEIHGTEGSLIGQGVMTQEPTGTVVLRRPGQEETIDVGEREDLYAHAVRHFNAAVRGEGRPFATGHDGVRSLAVALAAREAAQTGRRVPVRYP